jgi:hypothetical protein
MQFMQAYNQMEKYMIKSIQDELWETIIWYNYAKCDTIPKRRNLANDCYSPSANNFNMYRPCEAPIIKKISSILTYINSVKKCSCSKKIYTQRRCNQRENNSCNSIVFTNTHNSNSNTDDLCYWKLNIHAIIDDLKNF